MLLVDVQQPHDEGRLEIVGEADVEQRVHRIDAALARDVLDAAAFQGGFGRRHRHFHQVPGAVEDAAALDRRGQRRLERRAKRGIDEQRTMLRLVAGLGPRRDGLQHVGVEQAEIHVERLARGLGIDRMAARARLGAGGGDSRRMLGLRRIVEQRAIDDGPAGEPGQFFHEGNGRALAAGRHGDAVAVPRHHPRQRAELVVAGQARRHRDAAIAVVVLEGRGAQPDGAGRQRFVEQRRHLREFVGRRLALGACIAHHHGAQRRVRAEGGDVGRDATPGDEVEVAREIVELPVDALAQRVERHRLDLGEIPEQRVARGRRRRGNAEAAIADHHRRDAQRRRRRGRGIPGELRVVMGVDVDHAGRQHQARRVHRLARRPEIAADGGDAPVLHRDVHLAHRIAEPVGHVGIDDDQIEHAILPERAALRVRLVAILREKREVVPPQFTAFPRRGSVGIEPKAERRAGPHVGVRNFAAPDFGPERGSWTPIS